MWFTVLEGKCFDPYTSSRRPETGGGKGGRDSVRECPGTTGPPGTWDWESDGRTPSRFESLYPPPRLSVDLTLPGSSPYPSRVQNGGESLFVSSVPCPFLLFRRTLPLFWSGVTHPTPPPTLHPSMTRLVFLIVSLRPLGRRGGAGRFTVSYLGGFYFMSVLMTSSPVSTSPSRGELVSFGRG